MLVKAVSPVGFVTVMAYKSSISRRKEHTPLLYNRFQNLQPVLLYINARLDNCNVSKSNELS